MAVERVREGEPATKVIEAYGFNRTTIYKWINRHRAEGTAGLVDRSSRPHHSPGRTPIEVAQRIIDIGQTPYKKRVLLGTLG